MRWHGSAEGAAKREPRQAGLRRSLVSSLSTRSFIAKPVRAGIGIVPPIASAEQMEGFPSVQHDPRNAAGFQHPPAGGAVAESDPAFCCAGRVALMQQSAQVLGRSRTRKEPDELGLSRSELPASPPFALIMKGLVIEAHAGDLQAVHGVRIGLRAKQRDQSQRCGRHEPPLLAGYRLTPVVAISDRVHCARMPRSINTHPRRSSRTCRKKDRAMCNPDRTGGQPPRYPRSRRLFRPKRSSTPRACYR